MPKALEAIAALKGKWAGVSDRASLDQPAVNVPAADLTAVLRFLKDDQGFDMLVDVAGIDWSLLVSPRFSVVYHLLSTTDHDYIRLAVDCPSDLAPEVPSSVELWPGANWHEREAFDMFGIRFTGHPDLRRILMWDAFRDHPMRKDYVEPDDYEWEPTPHGDVLAKARRHYPPAAPAAGEAPAP